MQLECTLNTQMFHTFTLPTFNTESNYVSALGPA